MSSQDLDEEEGEGGESERLDTEGRVVKGKGKKKKKKGKFRNKEPARWIDVNLDADKKVTHKILFIYILFCQYFNVIGDETGVASLNEDAKINLNDYSSIEIIDPITQ